MPRHRHRCAAVGLAILIAAAPALAACGSSTTPDELGVLEIVDGRAHLTVPALWAAAQADGTRAGGVEPAEIVVSTMGETSTYGVDLADIEAKGAGPAWRAATSMASAFATIFVGADPNSVDYHFTVTGPIDGPSAGGILTVGIIAAFRGASLAPGATMTGTITADGSIGAVGGVATKIEAAADEGFTTIVVPEAIDPEGWAAGNRYTELADALGVTVVPVNTIGDAYAVMTGESLPVAPPAPVTSVTWPASVQTVTRDSTEDLIDTLDALTAATPAQLDADAHALAQQTLTQARVDLAAGAVARAYGTTALALTRLARATGAASVEAVLATQGPAAARRDLQERARALLVASRAALDESAAAPARGLEQQFALPIALAWATFSEVTMAGLLAELPAARSEGALVEMGRSIAEGELGVRVMLPDAVEVALAVPDDARVDHPDLPALMADYSAFILRAAQAGEQYLADVLGQGLSSDGGFANNGYLVAAVAARDLVETVTPTVDSYPAEARQLSLALTYFWLVSHAIASEQAYGVVAGSDRDDVDAARQDAMDAAIDDTWDFIVFRSSELSRADVDPSGATWSAAWAFEQSRANRGTELATEAGWLAQGELWYDSVQAMMLVTAIAPNTITAPPAP